MRGAFFYSFSKIDSAFSVDVERVAFAGVDKNHEQTSVSVEHFSLVESPQIPEDRGIIK